MYTYRSIYLYVGVSILSVYMHVYMCLDSIGVCFAGAVDVHVCIHVDIYVYMWVNSTESNINRDMYTCTYIMQAYEFARLYIYIYIYI